MGEKRHHFLTGPRGVGKTTILREALQANRVVPAGFITWRAVTEQGICVCMAAPVQEGVPDKGIVIAVREQGRMALVPGHMEKTGVELLARRPCGPVFLMDELGYLESGVPAFCAAVEQTLDGNTPCIGVLRDRNTPFLDRIRARQDVEVYTVEEENRAGLAEFFTRLVARLPGVEGGV